MIARTSTEAWSDLCAAGGLELTGRDADLPAALRARLDPEAPTLDAAIAGSTIDQLLAAFFATEQAYIDMFRDILHFYSAAGANEGKSQWRLATDGAELGLEDFTELLERWDSVESELDVPALDFHGQWAMARAMFEHPAVEPEFKRRHEEGYKTGNAEVDAWLAAYAAGSYLPFPASLEKMGNAGPSLKDAIGVAQATLDVIRARWDKRHQLDAARDSGAYKRDDSDAFAPGRVLYDEHDLRTANTIRLHTIIASLGQTERDQIDAALAEVFARYSRRKIGVRVSLRTLESILSLPVWKQRHELYAVWIGTEIVRALPAHRCEIHHDNGRIEFAFRETLLATVHATRPKVQLYGERRTALPEKALGKSRTENVQPDYSLWRGAYGADTCGLVVEVKHYKKNSPQSFSDALVDYARAHPRAIVILVNHGPANVDLDAFPEESRRCHVISELKVNFLERKEAFRTFIRSFVGTPVGIPAANGGVPAIDIAVDVSASMRAALTSPQLVPWLRSIAGDAATIAMVDDTFRGTGMMDTADTELYALKPQGGSQLRDPLEQLIDKQGEILLVTDRDGMLGLAGLSMRIVEETCLGGIVVALVELSA